MAGLTGHLRRLRGRLRAAGVAAGAAVLLVLSAAPPDTVAGAGPAEPDPPAAAHNLAVAGADEDSTEAAAQPARQATASPAAAPVPAYRQANQVAVLTVHGVVDAVTLRSLERRVDAAVDDGADALVLELDTPGGALPATLDICHLFKTDAPANTVAWVNPQAYSAGTIIALACREIVVAPGATFGDAAPIQIAPLGGMQQLQPAERAKIESPLRAEVIDSARRHGYDENLVQAFVSVGMELWLIEHKQTGRRVFVGEQEYRAVMGEAPPQEMPSVSPPRSVSSASPGGMVERLQRELGAGDVESDRPEMTAEELRREIEFQQNLPPARSRLTEADRGEWVTVGQVVRDDQLLTVKPAEALHYGLAQAVIANDAELKAWFGAQSVTRYNENWAEALVRFLRNPIVMGVLIVVFLVSMFLELAAPGVGVFGATALGALGLLIFAPALLGLAQWWTLLAIGIGVMLIAVELFVIPGFGAAGVAGALALLVGLVGTFITGDVTTSAGRADLWTGLITTFTSLFAAGMVIWFVSRHVQSLPFLDRLVLSTELPGRPKVAASGGAAEGGAEPLLHAMAPPDRPAGPVVGEVGRALTPLRPSGRAEFDGRVHEVEALDGFVPAGAAVRVVQLGRFALGVEALEDPEA